VHAIIGAGNVGTALSAAMTSAGHRVFIADRDSAEAARVASETGAEAAPNAAAAAALADVVVLAVPWDAAEPVARAIKPVVNGKVVVDVTNPAKPDWSGPLFGGSDSGAERLAEWLPEAHVVKAFNTLLGPNMAGGGKRNGVQLDAYVAGDDPGAKDRVLRLAADMGFSPVDVGPLGAARQLEALAWLNISLNASNGWGWETGWKLVGAPAWKPAQERRAA
jgi:NADPH-dependent F420 reductase